MGPDHNIRQSFFSYILLQKDSFIRISYLIGVSSHELDPDHRKEETRRFMEFVETKIGNKRKHLYEANFPETI